MGLLREDGLDAVSMRRVAERLGVAPNSIYAHVADKAALIDDLIDAMLGDVPTPTDHGWRERIERVMRDSRRALLAHPDLIPFALVRQSVGPNALRLGEVTLTALHETGLNGPESVTGLQVLLVHTIGSAAFETGRAQDPEPAARQPPWPRTRGGLRWRDGGTQRPDLALERRRGLRAGPRLAARRPRVRRRVARLRQSRASRPNLAETASGRAHRAPGPYALEAAEGSPDESSTDTSTPRPRRRRCSSRRAGRNGTPATRSVWSGNPNAQLVAEASRLDAGHGARRRLRRGRRRDLARPAGLEGDRRRLLGQRPRARRPTCRGGRGRRPHRLVAGRCPRLRRRRPVVRSRHHALPASARRRDGRRDSPVGGGRCAGRPTCWSSGTRRPGCSPT